MANGIIVGRSGSNVGMDMVGEGAAAPPPVTLNARRTLLGVGLSWVVAACGAFFHRLIE